MKVFRQVEGSRYLYYVQDEDKTVLWYPELTWRSRVVPQPTGRLLAEGAEEPVMVQIRGFLPADLVEAIQKSCRTEEPHAPTAPKNH